MSGKFIISLDFEKYWGIRDHKEIDEYRNNLENIDKVVLNLLKKFDSLNIHCTWGIVGFLFYNNKKNVIKNLPSDTQFYNEQSLNQYKYIKNNNLEPKYHFAQKSIDNILFTDNQEIASHTYSHYYCLEEGQNIGNFKQDLDLFKLVSELKCCEISTIIFPRNQINSEYIPILKEYGINVYRGNEEHFLYNNIEGKKFLQIKRALRFVDRYINISGHNTYKPNTTSSIYNMKSSRFLAPYIKKLKYLEPLRLKRIKSAMTYAAINDEVFHLWWHPHNFGNNMVENMKFLDNILNHYVYLNKEYGMESKNIKEAVKELTLFENSNDSR